MTYKGFLLSASMLATLGLTACASAINGGSQRTEVVVRGSGKAYCEFYNDNFRNAGHFPNTVTLERSRQDLTADCVGEEGRKIKFNVPSTLNNAGTAGNVTTGVVPGVAYDAAMGSIWSYPDPIIVDFRQVGTAEQPEWPEGEEANRKDRRAFFEGVKSDLKADAKATPKAGMQPVLDLDPAVPARTKAKPVVVETISLSAQEPKAGEVVMVVAEQDRSLVEPIISPEDHMGLHPARVKAERDAKAKAARDAKAAKEAEAKAAKAAKDAERAEAAAQAKRAADQAAAAAAAAAAADAATAEAAAAANAAADAADTVETLSEPASGAPAADVPSRYAPAQAEPTPVLPTPFASEAPAEAAPTEFEPVEETLGEGEIPPQEQPTMGMEHGGETLSF